MTRETLPPYLPEVESLLDAERTLPSLDSAIEERIYSSVAGTLNFPPVGGGSGPASQGPASPSVPPTTGPTVGSAAPATGAVVGGSTIGRFIAIGAIAFAAGAVATDIAHRVTAPPPSDHIVSVSHHLLPVSPPRSPGDTPTEELPSIVEVETTPPPSKAVKQDRPAPRNVNDERQMIEIARTAIARGHLNEALRELDRHTIAYPRGQLAEEREALRIIAFASVGRREQASRRAERFRRIYPRSVFIPAIDRALEE